MSSPDKLNQNSTEKKEKNSDVANSKNEKNPEKIKALQEISKAEARIQAAKN